MGTMRDVAVDKNLHFTHIRQPKLNCFPDSKWYESILLLRVIAACVISTSNERYCNHVAYFYCVISTIFCSQMRFCIELCNS